MGYFLENSDIDRGAHAIFPAEVSTGLESAAGNAVLLWGPPRSRAGHLRYTLCPPAAAPVGPPPAGTSAYREAGADGVGVMKRCPACRRVYDRDAKFCQIDGTTLADFDSDPLIGHTIAKRYRLVRRLGSGPLARSTWPPSSRPGGASRSRFSSVSFNVTTTSSSSACGTPASRRPADLLTSPACTRLTGRTTDGLSSRWSISRVNPCQI